MRRAGSSCFLAAPGEESLEDVGWGLHGIFSHMLAEGLRGRANLNGDGLCSWRN